MDGVLLGYGMDEMCSSGRGQVLAPWPNRLAAARYEWDGDELQLPVNETATGSAIHGLVRWANWRAVERGPARVVLEHVLHPQPGYPSRCASGSSTGSPRRPHGADGGGEVGARSCPFGVGHHPVRRRADGPRRRSASRGRAGRRAGARRDPAQAGRLARRGGGRDRWADDAWPWQQMFSGDLPDVARRGLAVEPMTCPPQAFRTGKDVIRLEPGERWSGEWGIETA